MTQYTRILCLGDSITYGARTPRGRDYPAMLEHHLSKSSVPSICLNAGVNGETMAEIVERSWGHLGSDAWLRICVALGGTNDSKPRARTPMQHYLRSWDALLRRCRLTDVILIALEIPAIHPIGQPEYDGASLAWICEANTYLQAWCEHNNVPYVGDFYATFMNGRMLADGIHPDEFGNAHIARRVAEFLSNPLPFNASGADASDVVDLESARTSRPRTASDHHPSVADDGLGAPVDA